MLDWRQRLALYLLAAGLTVLALHDKEYRYPVIAMLVPLVIWVIERKDKVEKEKQKKKQVIKTKEKRKKKRKRKRKKQ